MRPWLLMLLLLLSILTHDARGIRLIKGSVPADKQHSIREQFPGKRSNEGEGVEEDIVCKSKECSGRIRKLITMIHISSTTTIAKNDKNEEIKADPKLEALSSTNPKIGTKEEKFSVNSSSKTQQEQPSPEPYPDTIDIAGMDYSLQARRKPPIHN